MPTQFRSTSGSKTAFDILVIRKHDPFIKFVFFRLGDLKDVFYLNKIQFL